MLIRQKTDGSLDDDHHDITIAGGSRRQALRRDNSEGKGEELPKYPRKGHDTRSVTDLMTNTKDNVRSLDASFGGGAPRCSNPDIGPFEAFCVRAQADKGPALCVSSEPSHTDEGVEGCSTRRRLFSRKRSRKSRLHPGFPQGPTRRGDRGSKNHPDSTWIEIHQSRHLPFISSDGAQCWYDATWDRSLILVVI